MRVLLPGDANLALGRVLELVSEKREVRRSKRQVVLPAVARSIGADGIVLQCYR